jgi:hypothetical protein
MKYLFKQAAGFDGNLYAKGVHEVPEHVEKHHFFKKMKDAALISEYSERVLVHPSPAKVEVVKKEDKEEIKQEVVHQEPVKRGKKK